MSAVADARVSVDTPGGAVEVELFQAAPGSPGVVVLHEIFGLNDDMRRIGRRFADNGYTAAIPDLFHGKHWTRCMWSAIRQLGRQQGPIVDDVEAVVSALEARDDTGPVGIVGFCMGGGFAGLLGTRRPLGAVGMFYGEPPARERIAERMCPVFAGYGEKDPTYAKQGRRFERDLDELGVPHEVVFYPNAGHSYMNDAGHPVLSALVRPVMAVGYDPEASEDSWARMLAFFAEHLHTEDATRS